MVTAYLRGLLSPVAPRTPAAAVRELIVLTALQKEAGAAAADNELHVLASLLGNPRIKMDAVLNMVTPLMEKSSRQRMYLPFSAHAEQLKKYLHSKSDHEKALELYTRAVELNLFDRLNKLRKEKFGE